MKERNTAMRSTQKHLLLSGVAACFATAGCSTNFTPSSSYLNVSFGERDVTVSEHGVTRHLHVKGDAKFENDWPVSATKDTIIDITQSEKNKPVKAVQFRKVADKIALFTKNGSQYSPATETDEQWTRGCLRAIVAQNGILNGDAWGDEGALGSQENAHQPAIADQAAVPLDVHGETVQTNEFIRKASDSKLALADQAMLVNELFREDVSERTRKMALLALCKNPSLSKSVRVKIVYRIDEIHNPETREQILKALALH